MTKFLRKLFRKLGELFLLMIPFLMVPAVLLLLYYVPLLLVGFVTVYIMISIADGIYVWWQDDDD